MKTKNLLNLVGHEAYEQTRRGRNGLDSLVSRFSVASLICICMLTVGVGNVWGAEAAYKTAKFGSAATTCTNANSYSNSWTSTYSGFTVTVNNGNNSNCSWNHVRFGSKSAASTGTIVTGAIDKKVSIVSINLNAVNTTYTTSIKLYTSTNGSTWTERGSFSKSEGTQSVTIPTANRATGLYYKVEIVCSKSTNSVGNGFVQISQVDYKVETFTMSYNANGGTGSLSDANSPYFNGSTVTIKDNSFSRDGYTFDHWDTKSDDSGTDYAPAATFSISANTTLYAQWVADGCSNYSFHYGATRGTKSITDQTVECFSRVGSTDEYQVTGFTIPATSQSYFVGYTNYWYDDGMGTGSCSPNKPGSSLNYFYYLPITHLQAGCDGKTGAGLPHAYEGAYGTIRIYQNSCDANLYAGFKPQGYQMRVGSGDDWENVELTVDPSDETVWTSAVMDVDATMKEKKYYVNIWTGSAYSSSDDGVSINNWTNGDNKITSMRHKTNSGDNWADGVAAGSRGFFRTWVNNCANNGYMHFVPTHRIIYHANYPVGDSPADTYSADVSVEETKSDIALNDAPSAPGGYTFAGWYDAASGGTKKTGNQTISAGASADPEYYAHWYGITLVVKDEDGTTLSGDGKPTLTRSGLSLTATTAGKYVFKDIQITSGTGTLSSTSSTTPTITAISSDITVTATFYKPIAVTKGTNIGAATFTLSATEVARGGNVTITCAADASHKGNPTITATSGNYSTISVASATSASVNGITGPVTINISYTAKETATVKLHVAGSTSTISGTRYEGDSYTLPSEAAECPDMGLYGWYNTSYYHASTAPSGAGSHSPGASVTLSAGDNDFYAVYATIGDLADTYTKITTAGELTTGDYLIVYEGYSYNWVMQNAYQSNESTMEDDDYALGTQISCTDATCIWRITKSTTTITICSTDNSKYFGFTSNHVALMNASQDLSYEVSGGKWAIYAGSDYLDYVTYFQRGASKVYDVSLYKRDQSISGPYTTTPSCTTHSLSTAVTPVSTGTAVAGKTVIGEGKTTTVTATPNEHYTFSYWTISGTGSTMSNTSDGKSTDNPVTVTMGTEDATITAHFTEKPKCTVVFKNNGTQLSSTTYWQGENPVAPALTDGTSHDACDETSDTHYGWTQTAWQNTLEQAAIDAKTAADVKVYAKDATLPAITAGDDGTTITYHAVWAEGSGGTTTISIDGSGLQAVVSSISSGYQSKDFTVGGYTFNASAVTKCTDTGTAQYWFQLKKNNDAITIPTLPGKITNISSTAIRTATSGSVSTGVYFNSSATTSAAIASETLSGATSFSLDVTGNNTSGYFLVGAATCINQLSVTYSTASYSKYLTTCCEYIVDAPTVTGTPTKNSITLNWTNVTGATGYTVTSSGGTPGDVSSDGTARSCVITGLSPNTNYTWSVVATYTTPYCLANTANGNTTTSQVYAVSYNKNGGTIANLPSGGTYAAGEEVTVAAKPDGTVSKGGYTFTGWNTANDGSGEHYNADGSTSFTMPSEAVVLYAEWTAKKNYFIDRMHGNWDGEHTEPTTGYNCYLREGAGYTVPDLSDNDTGSNSCVSGHAHFVGWVASGMIDTQGGLKSGYTIIKGGTSGTAGTDGTIYYAVWAEE